MYSKERRKKTIKRFIIKGKNGKLKLSGVKMSVLSTKVYKALLRLKKYEETGLSPKKVKKLSKAEKEGRLLVLPCKIGADIYMHGKPCRGIPEYIACGKALKNDPLHFKCLAECPQDDVVLKGKFSLFYFDDLGKRVFLTREEAEISLVEKQNIK